MTTIFLTFMLCVAGFFTTIFSIPRELAQSAGILKAVVFQLALFSLGMLLNGVALLNKF